MLHSIAMKCAYNIIVGTIFWTSSTAHIGGGDQELADSCSKGLHTSDSLSIGEELDTEGNKIVLTHICEFFM